MSSIGFIAIKIAVYYSSHKTNDILFCDGFAAENNQPFYHIPKFADITAPRTIGEHLHCFWRHLFHWLAIFVAQLFNEIICQYGDVFLPLIQRRHMDQYDTEPVVKIFPEIAVFDLLLNVFVGGCNHPHIHLYRFVAPYPCDDIILQSPENLCLCRKAHIADFIQEQSTTIGLFKFSFPLFDGRGKCPFFVTEKFTFD